MDTIPATLLKTLMAGLFGVALFFLLFFAIQYEKTSNFIQDANGMLQRGASVTQINNESQKDYGGMFSISNVTYGQGKGLGNNVTYTLTERVWLPSFTNSTPTQTLFAKTYYEQTQIQSR